MILPPSLPTSRPLWLALAGGGLLLLTLGGLLSHAPGSIDVGSSGHEAAFTAFGCAAVAIYFAAVLLVLHRTQQRVAIWLVLAIALTMRLIVLAGPPFRSSDIFRYVWDGEVQNAGINPYRYVPADLALRSLRDPAIYPHINRADYAHTIYPPVAQLLFRAVAAISPTTLAMRLAMLAFDLLAILVVVRLLAAAGIDRARVLIYAWNPLVVWELPGNGHVDAAAIGCIALALLAWTRRRDGWTGAALAAAVLVKFLPLAVFPAFWRRWDWRMPLVMLVMILGCYALYASVGWHVLGFLPGYTSEEGLGNGQGILWLEALSRVTPLPRYAGAVWFAVVALALGGLAVWMMLLRPQPAQRDLVAAARDIGILACATVIAITPHYPWYFAWLALPCCLAPSAAIIWLSAAAFLQNHDPFGDYVVQMACIYLPFLALLVIDLKRRGAAMSHTAQAPILRSTT
jgi:alpha-1,6-mannosyltransferase